MKYNAERTHKMFTLEEVRKLIAKRYDGCENGGSMQRPLFIHKSKCNHGKPGCLFFALNGSPPKGYALYVPAHQYLLIINAWGKVTRYQDCILTDENYKAIDINKVNFREIMRYDP